MLQTPASLPQLLRASRRFHPKERCSPRRSGASCQPGSAWNTLRMAWLRWKGLRPLLARAFVSSRRRDEHTSKEVRIEKDRKTVSVDDFYVMDELALSSCGLRLEEGLGDVLGCIVFFHDFLVCGVVEFGSRIVSGAREMSHAGC